MESLTGFMKTEHPRIEAELIEIVKQLPASTRPVAGHILASGGKRIRPMLTLLTAQLLGCHSDNLHRLASTLELIHTATLLHDDVLDNATLRRNTPAAHVIYGIPQAILAGDALLARANSLVAHMGDTALTACLAEAITRTAAGEIYEIASQHTVPTGDNQYIEIITDKTAWLIRAACELGALHAKAPKSLVEACATYGLNLGIGFQMVDDILDFAPESQTGKPSGGDLREGKYTAPIRLYAESLSPEARGRFTHKFQHKAFTEEDIQSIALVIRTMHFDQAATVLAGAYFDTAAQALDVLPEQPEKNVLYAMIDLIRTRDK